MHGAVASLQRTMAFLEEQKTAAEDKAAAMEESAQVQLARAEARAEASQVQVRDLQVAVEAAQAQAKDLEVQVAEREAGAEWSLAILAQSSKETGVEKGRADTAEAQVLQVQQKLANVTWRLEERTEQGDSCYAELVKTTVQVQELERQIGSLAIKYECASLRASLTYRHNDDNA